MPLEGRGIQLCEIVAFKKRAKLLLHIDTYY
jgi:hypothetical protein